MTPLYILGDEGVIHGITQTDASVVVASQELLPRLIRNQANVQIFVEPGFEDIMFYLVLYH